jgi:hypothetical protein
MTPEFDRVLQIAHAEGIIYLRGLKDHCITEPAEMAAFIPRLMLHRRMSKWANIRSCRMSNVRQSSCRVDS